MEIILPTALSSIENCFREANNAASNSYHFHQSDDFDEYNQIACYYVEKAFIETLILLEQVRLTSTYQIIHTMFDLAKKDLTKKRNGLRGAILGMD